MSSSGRNGLALPLLVALVAGLLAAWIVRNQIDRAATAGGAPVTVVVANAPIEAGAPIAAEELDALLVERTLPSDFAPVDAIAAREGLVGAKLVAAVEAGAILTTPLIAGRRSDPAHRLRPGERAVSIDVRSAPDGAVLEAGDRVDLIASGFDGAPSSELLLSGGQILAAITSGEKPGIQRITLRVAADQTAGLVRADVFAREVRAIRLSARTP